MALRLPDYLRKAHKESKKQGWLWEHKQGSKHMIVTNPNGEFVVCISLTAFDGPVTNQVKSTLRRAKCPGMAR